MLSQSGQLRNRSTDQQLRRAYNQRDWALGFYDGRIRVRAEDVAGDRLDDLLAHELAHAFLHHAYGNTVPIWVHEGYAQLQESPRPLEGEAARIEQGIRSRTLWIPLPWLDRRFAQPSGTEDVGRAYLQSRLVVQELLTRYGRERFHAWLKQLARGVAIEPAFDDVFAPSRWARVEHGIFD